MSTETYTSAQTFTLHASAAETATVNSAAVYLGSYREAVALLNVTAIGGTPSMTVKFQTSNDGVTWYDLGIAFAAVSTVSTPPALALTNFGTYVRAVQTISGTTPSLTYTLFLVAKS